MNALSPSIIVLQKHGAAIPLVVLYAFVDEAFQEMVLIAVVRLLFLFPSNSILIIIMFVFTLLPHTHNIPDIDECALSQHNCHSKARCRNTPGSFVCICRKGFSGDGNQCSGKKRSLISPQIPFSSFFVLTLPSTDIDECALSQHNCHTNAWCRNTIGKYVCGCKRGFSGNGIQCSGKRVKFYINLHY